VRNRLSNQFGDEEGLFQQVQDYKDYCVLPWLQDLVGKAKSPPAAVAAAALQPSDNDVDYHAIGPPASTILPQKAFVWSAWKKSLI
jgi:hypothetical protein